MNPIIFDKNETSFDNNGYGRLFPISCKVEEERNGKYEAELEVTDSDKHYGDIELGSILGLKVSDGSTQLFRIYKINKIVDDVIRINAAHISYDLSYIPVAPIQNALGIQEALASWKSNSLVSNPFTIDTDIVSEAAYSMNHPLSARAYLGGTEGSFLDKWHGEYEFDNYDVFLHESRGSNNGITIRYGKNLTSLEDEESIEDSADGILPYWTDGRFYVMGSIARKSQGNKIISIDVSGDITLEEGQEMPTVEEVDSKGTKYLTALVTGSKQNIRVSWYEDNSISEVQLCDIVNVIYDPYSINVEMKVTKTIWNVLEEHYEEVELGEYRSFVKTLSEMSTDISNLKYNDNQLVVRLERTEDGIEAEVTRATTQEEILSTQIDVTAEGIKSVVAANVKEYNEGNLSIDYYGYGEPSNTQYPPGDNNGKKYLDRSTGYYYTCNGSTWVRSAQPLQEMTDKMESEIQQTAREVKLSVNSMVNYWDTGVYTISVYGVGEPTNDVFPPDTHSYEYYLDQQNGYIWYSNGSYWSYTATAILNSKDVYGELGVKLDNDDDGTIISLISGSANKINFNATNLFTVTSPNFNVDNNGNVSAKNFIGDNCVLKETTTFKDEYDSQLGYIGKTTVESEDGFGMRNDSSGTGAVLINPSSGNLWLKGEGRTVKLSSDGLEPWRATAFGTDISLGSSNHAWSDFHAKQINLYNDATTSTNSHLGSAQKLFVKDGTTEYNLKAYIKGLIDGSIT